MSNRSYIHDTKCCSQQRHHHRMQWREMNLFYYFFNRFIVKCLWEFPSCPIPFSVFLRFVCCSLFLLGTDIFLYHSKKKQNDLLSHSVYMWPHKKRGKKSSLYVGIRFFHLQIIEVFFFFFLMWMFLSANRWIPLQIVSLMTDSYCVSIILAKFNISSLYIPI